MKPALRVLALLVTVSVSATPSQPGWTTLFNGKDFTGWKIGGAAESFTIEDGAIVAKGAASHCFTMGRSAITVSATSG